MSSALCFCPCCWVGPSVLGVVSCVPFAIRWLWSFALPLVGRPGRFSLAPAPFSRFCSFCRAGLAWLGLDAAGAAVPLLLAPGPLGLVFFFGAGPCLVPWGLALLPCLWGPFSPLALFSSLHALLPLDFPPLCAAAVHLVPMGCVVVALPPVPAGGALASVVPPFALLCSLLGALGLSWQGGCVAWMLSCLLAWHSP